MSLDLNADIGEGLVGPDVDAALLQLISSANIACGFHAGDPVCMRLTARIAVENGVRIGAHVGYWDRQGFGRRELGLEPDRVEADVAYQVGALIGCASLVGGTVAYVKPHGALYSRCHADREMGEAVARAIRSVDRGLAVMAPPGSSLQAAAERSELQVVLEGFVDRRYQADGQLTPRSRHGSVLGEREAIAQATSILRRGSVRTEEGATLSLRVDSLCIHGDTPWAIPVAQQVRKVLDANPVTLSRA